MDGLLADVFSKSFVQRYYEQKSQLLELVRH
jgi:hypothetical protein